MTVDLGLMLAPGPLPGQLSKQFLRDIESFLPHLEDHLHSLWMSDHLFWEDAPTFEAWTVMSYLLGKYPTFDVGSIVLGQSYRNPAYLAKSAATLQIMSNGRLIMGIGAGWKEDEYRAYDYEFPRAGIRIEQLDEAIDIMRRLWTHSGKVTYHGKHYHVIDAICEPKLAFPPPILIGGQGDKMLNLIARQADWWNLSDSPLEKWRDRLGVLKQQCEAVERPFDTLRLTWQGRLSVAATEAEARDMATQLGRDHYDGWPIEGALVGTPAQIVDQMGAFIDLGVDYFIFDLIGLPDTKPIDLLVNDVLPQIANR